MRLFSVVWYNICYTFLDWYIRIHNRLGGSLWKNWSQQIVCYPETHFYPRTLDQLTNIIKRANKEGKRVRAIGRGHSFSGITTTDGFMIHTDYLTGCSLGPVLNEEKYGRLNHTVVCKTGTSLYSVDDFLQSNGLVIGSNVVLSIVTIGGVCLTGSHGTGIKYSTISDRIYEMKIVDSCGTLRTFTEGITPDDVMSAVKLNLGAFGVLYEVTLRVEKDTNCHTINKFMDLNELLSVDSMKRLFETYPWVEMYWFPFSDKMFLKLAETTDNKISRLQTFANKVKYKLDSLLSVVLASIGNTLFTSFPDLVHWAGTRGFFFFTSFDTTKPLRYTVHYTDFIHYTGKVYNPETVIGFNLTNDGYSKIIDIIKSGMDVIKSHYTETGHVPCTLGLNIRFTQSSECLLSPCNFNKEFTHCIWIEPIVSKDAIDADDFVHKWNSHFINTFDARLHWAKNWESIPITSVRPKYNLEKFDMIKDAYGVDPIGMFMNPTLESIFST